MRTENLMPYLASSRKPIDRFDRALALILLILCIPIGALNTVLAVLQGKSIFKYSTKFDITGHPVHLKRFNCGWSVHSIRLWDVLKGRFAFCGLPLFDERLEIPLLSHKRSSEMKTGLISLYGIHQQIGLMEADTEQLLEEQLKCNQVKAHLRLLLKGTLCNLLYKRNLPSPDHFYLFGIKINNQTKAKAIQWITQPRKKHCNIGVFVNAHSMNLAVSDPTFQENVNKADQIFADGSGVRLAANHLGISLKDNINGTDLLPHLCKSAIKKHLSIYLLGAEPGVAKQASKNLTKRFPKLHIAGTHHGFFEANETEDVIKKINASQCNILLVALGSPIQEKWLLDNRDALHCRNALAVGGLLDFYAEKISRAPRWMREIGMEWVWRLIQEPGNKWKRYVLGNPLFLLRMYFHKKESHL